MRKNRETFPLSLRKGSPGGMRIAEDTSLLVYRRIIEIDSLNQDPSRRVS